MIEKGLWRTVRGISNLKMISLPFNDIITGIEEFAFRYHYGCKHVGLMLERPVVRIELSNGHSIDICDLISSNFLARAA